MVWLFKPKTKFVVRKQIQHSIYDIPRINSFNESTFVDTFLSPEHFRGQSEATAKRFPVNRDEEKEESSVLFMQLIS